ICKLNFSPTCPIDADALQKVAYMLALFIIFYSAPLLLGLGWSFFKHKVGQEWLASLRIIYYTAALLIMLVFGGVTYDFIYFQF
ncbi:MAG: hypothetical protein WCO69_06770, partial [Candidatus Omnitrophota bacterium]